jgi:hypothetical protein
VFWLAIPLGGMVILMLQYLTGGRWGIVLRRVLEASADTLPLLALLYLPLVLAMVQPFIRDGVAYPYLWLNATAVEHDSELQQKTFYLNPGFFFLRAAVYFAVWCVLGWRLRWGSPQPDTHFDVQREYALQQLSGPGIILYGLTITFAAVDWIMSLDPFWYSTIFGVLLASAQILPALTFAIAVLALSTTEPSVARTMTPQLWKDLGNLLLAFVLIWSYMAFCQYFLIWNGNLPDETRWYWFRMVNGWELLGIALIVLYFGLPFGLLLLSDLKSKPQRLVWVTGLVLAMHYVYSYWMIVPEHASEWKIGTEGAERAQEPLSLLRSIHWLDPVAWVAVGGLWLAFFLWKLRIRSLIADQHPALQEEVPQHG